MNARRSAVAGLICAGAVLGPWSIAPVAPLAAAAAAPAAPDPTAAAQPARSGWSAVPTAARAAIRRQLDARTLAAAKPPQQKTFLFAPGEKNDQLGSAVAVSGNTIVVGAPGKTVNGHKLQGAADVFVKPAAGWAHAKLTTKLTLAHGHHKDAFGYSVAIAGTTIAVGTPVTHTGSNQLTGSAYVFQEPARGWRHIHHPTGRLVPTDNGANDEFGWSLAAAGDTIVVGAPTHTVGQETGEGAAYVFIEPAGGWGGTRHQQAELVTDEDAHGSQVGYSVGISGRTIVAGAPYRTIGGHPSRGAAYVFVEPPQGWTSSSQTAELTPSSGRQGDFFGTAVAVSGTTVVAGAPYHKVGTHKTQGAAYVFVRPNAGWAGGQHQQATLIVKPGGRTNAFFGAGVAIDGNTIMGNGFGVDAIFIRPGGGWSGVRHQRSVITGLAGTGSLGKAIAISNHLVVAGSPLSPVKTHPAQGLAYVFVRR